MSIHWNLCVSGWNDRDFTNMWGWDNFMGFWMLQHQVCKNPIELLQMVLVENACNGSQERVARKGKKVNELGKISFKLNLISFVFKINTCIECMPKKEYG